MKAALTQFAAYIAPRIGRREDYSRFFRAWEEIWGEREVADVKPMDVEQRYLSRLTLGLSGARLNFERNLLRRFFRWAMAHELCARDPVSTWPAHPSAEKEPRIIPEGAEGALFDLLPEWARRCAWVSLYTLIRQGTARKLRWSDVVEVDGARVLVIPAAKMKTKKALRIPLCAEAVRALGERPAKDGPLFPELRSKGLMYHYIRRAGRRLGLEPAPGWHDLRKTGATRLLKRGVPVPVVMRLGGWKKLPTLLNHYMGAVSDVEAREALAKI